MCSNKEKNNVGYMDIRSNLTKARPRYTLSDRGSDKGKSEMETYQALLSTYR